MLVDNGQLHLQLKKTLRVWGRLMRRKYLIKQPKTRIVVHKTEIAASKPINST
jgi:hypothetical protein